MSQILLQRSLRPQQLRNQNENLISRIKASELFALRHFNHLSPLKAQRTDHDDEPTYPPSTPLNATAQGCLVHEGEPHGRSTPPTPPFSESGAQEQAVVGTPFNNRKGGAGLQRYHHHPKLQGQERIQERNTSYGPPENSPEALYDKEDGQSMASQTVTAQSCSNGHLASVSTKATTRRQDEVQARPSHGIQTRSKTSRVAPSSTATSSPHGNNTPQVSRDPW